LQKNHPSGWFLYKGDFLKSFFTTNQSLYCFFESWDNDTGYGWRHLTFDLTGISKKTPEFFCLVLLTFGKTA